MFKTLRYQSAVGKEGEEGKITGTDAPKTQKTAPHPSGTRSKAPNLSERKGPHRPMTRDGTHRRPKTSGEASMCRKSQWSEAFVAFWEENHDSQDRYWVDDGGANGDGL
eukprot:scaffold128_cov248-Pinguiococcus_pyrenoidosus.AAC.44